MISVNHLFVWAMAYHVELLNNQRVYVIDYYKILMIIYDDGWNHLNPLVFGETPMDSRLEIISERCLHLGQLKEYSSSKCMGKPWEIHVKSMTSRGKPWWHGHVTIGIGYKSSCSKPYMGYKMVQVPFSNPNGWPSCIICSPIQFPRSKISLNHSKRPTIYAKMKRPKMDT